MNMSIIQLKNRNYYLYKHASVIGPYTYYEIQNRLNDGKLNLNDLYCLEGCNEWNRLNEIFKIEYTTKEYDILSKTLKDTKQYMLNKIKNVSVIHDLKVPDRPATKLLDTDNIRELRKNNNKVRYMAPIEATQLLNNTHKKNVSLVHREVKDLKVINNHCDKKIFYKVIIISVILVLILVFGYIMAINFLLKSTVI